MKKTTILTFILGSLLGGASVHHVMKHKEYYKAAFEVGEDLGAQVAEKFLTKIEDKMNKKEKKMIEYDHEPEVYPEDKQNYIPIKDFENGTFQHRAKEEDAKRTIIDGVDATIKRRFEFKNNEEEDAKHV